MNDLAARLHVAARMAHIAPFEVMEIQTLARELEAHGRDVIHLEIGEPDFRTPAPVVEAAKRALDAQPMFYTSALGMPAAARGDLAASIASRYGVEVPASRIVVTAGSSAALLLAFGVLLDPGDEVLLADPSYPCNRHFVRALGAVPRPVAGRARTRDTSSRRRSRGAIGTRATRMAMVATPVESHRHARRARRDGGARRARARARRHAARRRDLPRPHLRRGRAHRRSSAARTSS